MVHAQPSDLLEKAQHHFTLAPSVQHHGNGTNVHAVRSHKQQVTAHAIQFGQQHANPHCAFWNVAINSKQFFGRHAEHQLIVQRRQVVHARNVCSTLHEGERLTSFLHARVQVPNNWLASQNGFALQFKHQSQHAVCTWVLRTHVDDHGLIFARVGFYFGKKCSVCLAHAQHCANFAHHFFCSQFRA